MPIQVTGVWGGRVWHSRSSLHSGKDECIQAALGANAYVQEKVVECSPWALAHGQGLHCAEKGLELAQACSTNISVCVCVCVCVCVMCAVCVSL